MMRSRLPRLDADRVVACCGMLDFDGRTLRVDVTGWTPIVEVARRLHLSEYTPLDASQYLQDVVGQFAGSLRDYLALGLLVYALGELYRRGFEIQPTRYASAHGVARVSGSASPRIVE